MKLGKYDDVFDWAGRQDGWYIFTSMPRFYLAFQNQTFVVMYETDPRIETEPDLSGEPETIVVPAHITVPGYYEPGEYHPRRSQWDFYKSFNPPTPDDWAGDFEMEE